MLAAVPQAKNICSSLPPQAGALILGKAAPRGMVLAHQPRAARRTLQFSASPFSTWSAWVL